MLEFTAVLLALAYVVLAIKEQRSCWLASAISASLYVWIFADAALYMESLLQLFYIGASIYGWFCWGAKNSSEELSIQRWSLQNHFIAVIATLLAATILGALLDQYTHAALPWLDSFTTVAALITTWMAARKILESWLYWIVIDLLSVYLYSSRELDMTAVLFGGYVLLAIAGFWEWYRHYQAQTASKNIEAPLTEASTHALASAD